MGLSFTPTPYGGNPMNITPQQRADAAARAALSTPATPTKPWTTPQPKKKKPRSWLAGLTAGQIAALAEKQVVDAINAQAAPIKSAQAAAAQRALGAEKAVVGFTNAAQAGMKGLQAPLDAAYQQGQDAMSGLNLGAAAQPFAGFEGASLGKQGAAADSWAGMLGQIQGNQGQQDLAGLISQAETEQNAYAQQLIDLAAKRPDLKNQIMDKLYALEMEKLNARLKINQNTFANSVTMRQLTLRERAQADIEKQLGLTAKVAADKSALGWAGLKVKQDQYATANALTMKGLQQSGAQIDAAASKVSGHIVLKDGSTPLGKNGQPIKVVAASVSNAYGKMVKSAKGALGKPVLSPTGWSALGAQGKYVAADGVKGSNVYPGTANYPATTNNPRLAKKDTTMTFAEAVTFFTNETGLSRARVRQGLIAAGWKPDGKKPKAKPIDLSPLTP